MRHNTDRMKALVLTKVGSYLDLELMQLPYPEPGKDELLVAVEAVGLNPVDYKLALSGYPTWRMPHVLGLDVAGEVKRVGDLVTRFKPGDRVAYHGDLSKQGGLAEFALCKEQAAFIVPSSVSSLVAASLPCPALSAYHALVRRMNIKEGGTILVQAAAGGVGGFAVQIAKANGLTVYATCSKGNFDYVRSLGADHVVDYTSGDVHSIIRGLTNSRGVDYILESLSPAHAARNIEMLAYNGSMACLLGLPDLGHLERFTISPSLHEVSLGGAYLFGDLKAQADLGTMGSEVMDLLLRDCIRPLNLEIIPIEETANAFVKIESGHVRGKIVVEL